MSALIYEFMNTEVLLMKRNTKLNCGGEASSRLMSSVSFVEGVKDRPSLDFGNAFITVSSVLRKLQEHLGSCGLN